jgi:hypothetical protein
LALLLALQSPAALPPVAAAQAPSASAAAANPVPSLSLEQARTVAPGTLIRVVGYVVGAYKCPPCPPGAQCKPCAAPSEVFLAVSPDHARVVLIDPASDVFALAVDDPDAFMLRSAYRFELSTADRRSESIDGRAIRSQRPDDPIWPDASTERPGVVPAKP